MATTLRVLVELFLHHVLATRRRGVTFRLRKGSFGGEGWQPSARSLSWRQIQVAAYGDWSMIALDANIVMCAHREDSEWHAVG